MFEIGSSLREARLRQGLDFNDMEARTKVRAKYLRALEAEHFDQLPAHTYIKGFLRTYADALGMDGRLYVDEYNSRFVAGEDEQPQRTRRVPQARARRQKRESRIVVVTIGAIVLLTALVIAAWRFGGADEPRVEGVNTTARIASGRTSSTGRRVTLLLSAVRGASFVEVHAGSRSGELLYRGVLRRGASKRFVRPRLFVTAAAPANLDVRANGSVVRIPDAGEVAVSARTVAGS